MIFNPEVWGNPTVPRPKPPLIFIDREDNEPDTDAIELEEAQIDAYNHEEPIEEYNDN